MADVYDQEGHEARVIALDDLRRRVQAESNGAYVGLVAQLAVAVTKAVAELDALGVDGLTSLRILGDLCGEVTDATLKAVGL